MDFILGIFTGIGLAMFAGYYLNQKEKKKGVPKHSNPPPPPGSVGIYIHGKLVATGTPMQWEGGIKEDTPLDQQLQAAIESEDWETAARLRDLINKK